MPPLLRGSPRLLLGGEDHRCPPGETRTGTGPADTRAWAPLVEQGVRSTIRSMVGDRDGDGEGAGRGASGASAARTGAASVLLVEDDDGDALIVTELLADAGVDVELRRARTIEEAGRAMCSSPVDCLLLDLGLPDATGLDAVERVRAAAGGLPDPPAVVVLTGNSDVEQGVRAVAAGADDYLVKGETEAGLLGRSLRYALQRRAATTHERHRFRAEVRARETARLERALLPRPLVGDRHISVMVGYLPGRDGLLGGDFYDTVELPDGTVVSVIGDVAGSGPDEAALGATVRTAWRTLVLTGTPADEVIPLLERVLLTERGRPETFVTLCQLVVSPDRTWVDLYLAGHLPPLLITGPVGDVEVDVVVPTARGRALGVPVDGGWRPQRIAVTGPFSVVLHTDGLVEAPIGPDAAAAIAPEALAADRRGVPRLGLQGLRRLFAAEVDDVDFGGLVRRVMRRTHELHGGPLADDAAILLVGWTDHPDIVGERTATHADSEGWADGISAFWWAS